MLGSVVCFILSTFHARQSHFQHVVFRHHLIEASCCHGFYSATSRNVWQFL